MTIGIECDYAGTLRDVLGNIPVDKYNWFISEYEIICKNENVSFPFSLSAESFEGDLLNGENVIVFMKLEAYFAGSQYVPVTTYNEFAASPCQLLILVSDKTCWEIYTKDSGLLGVIKDNIRSSGGVDVMDKNSKRDGRTRMSVV